MAQTPTIALIPAFLTSIPEGDYAARKLYEDFARTWPGEMGPRPTASAFGRAAMQHPRVRRYRTAKTRVYAIRASLKEVVAGTVV